MSYILEALRKSERERQAGQTPTLAALVPEPPPRRRSWALWLVAGLLVLNGAGLAYLLLAGRGKTPPSVAAPPPPASPSATGKSAGTDSAPGTAIAVTGPAPVGTQSPPRTPPPAKPAPKPLQVPHPVPVAPKADLVPPPVARAIKPAPKPRSSLAGTRDGEFPELPESPEPAELPAGRVERRSLPPLAPPVFSRPPQPEAAPAPPADHDAMPWLDTLPAAIQQRMAPFRITLYAYSSVAAERFAIINAHKYRVGDRVAGDALLVDIRADSLVLELDGLRFRVPRP